MSAKRIVLQAVVAALLFWGIKLILERSTESDILIREGKTALLFGLLYGLYLVIRARFRNKE